jgi:hypothetical protein
MAPVRKGWQRRKENEKGFCGCVRYRYGGSGKRLCIICGV